MEDLNNTQQDPFFYNRSYGKYEILYGQASEPKNPDEYDYDYDTGLVKLNGALCNPNNHYEYKFKWKRLLYELDSIDFIMPNDDFKLSDVFENLPYGLIKKNRTGIGATTLELHSERNSIVVVPTRALAYEKAKKSWNEETQKYTILYVGSKISGFNIPSIADYLNDSAITYKKFIVVVDSLPILLNEIGKEHFKEYFIMFDEIDCYQYDSSFRPNMEKGFDYYFMFPDKQRCLISATIGKFTDPRINEEPIINITFNNLLPRDINTYETNDILITTKKHIESILRTSPDDKILIAFNLLRRGILPIIKSLSTEYQSKCAVLCSEKNKKDVGDLYCDMVERELPNQITFMTCTYFVGIDIEESFHLISVADVKYPFTLLSPHKLQQIAGRCRTPNTLLSETIIYNTNNLQLEVDIDLLSKRIVEEAQSLVDYYYMQSKLKILFPKLISNSKFIAIQEIVESSNKKYEGSSSPKLVREITNGLKISFFNIDNILIQVELLRTLYKGHDNLKKKLLADGHNIVNESVSENEHISVEIINKIEEEHQKNETEEREEIIAQLKKEATIESRKKLAQKLRTSSMNGNSLFLERFIDLQKYTPFESLIQLLSSIKTLMQYNFLRKQIFIWALSDNHPIKIAIRENFPVGEFFPGGELTRKLNSIWHGILNFDNLTNRQAVPMMHLFCEISGRTSSMVNRQKINGYKIMSYNPLKINGSPIVMFSENESMTQLLK